MKLLVPTDFSENANHAMKYAVVLAKALRAEIILFHVYPPPIVQGDIPYLVIADEIEQLRNQLCEKLRKTSLQISQTDGVSCKSLVMMGIAVEEIVNEVASSRIDMIVMGTHGASGLKKIFFGSHTATVIEKATCPVLCVPEDTPIALPANIVFATNYQESDMQTLKILSKLAETLDAGLTILHVTREKTVSEVDFIEDFSKSVARQTGSVQPSFHVLPHDDIQTGIETFVSTIGADLIALTTRKRTLFEKIFDKSLTKRMTYQARMPLLAFHASVVDEPPKEEDYKVSVLSEKLRMSF